MTSVEDATSESRIVWLICPNSAQVQGPVLLYYHLLFNTKHLAFHFKVLALLWPELFYHFKAIETHSGRRGALGRTQDALD